MTLERAEWMQHAAVQTKARKASRLFFIDYLRAALVILVVLHHVAVVYSAATPFYYVDPPPPQSLGALVLFLFALMNQAWFMSAFFLLAGYFTPASFDRKGAGAFLKDRLVRLGIPLIIYIFVLNPLAFVGLYLAPAPMIPGGFSWQSFWQLYPEFIGLGPTWFLAMLLIFCTGYVAWRQATRNRSSVPRGAASPPSYRAIGIFILALALASYLLRIVIPIGRSILDFPTLAYLPQYLSFFVLGTVAYRRDWFRTIPGSMGKTGFLIAVVGTLVLFPIIILGVLGGTFRFLGNGSWSSAIYALWDSSLVVGLSLAVMTFFRRFFNQESRFGQFLAAQSYAVYLIHSPIIVVLAYLLYLVLMQGGLDLGPLLKFSIASVVIIPVCFVVAYLIRKIPGVSKVI